MFRYEILRDQWLILGLIGGTALVFYFILYFYDYHTPRRIKEKQPGSPPLRTSANPEQSKPEGEQTKTPEPEYETRYRSAWQAIPWGLRVTIIMMIIFAISYSIHGIIHPYSW